MTAYNYLRRVPAAEYVKERYGFCTAGTLARLAVIGGGPRYRKIGKWPVYTPEDLDAWAQSKISQPVSSTSEYASK
ncbi:MAG: DNA-binding protein [Paracoccaceae bacterium]